MGKKGSCQSPQNKSKQAFTTVRNSSPCPLSDHSPFYFGPAQQAGSLFGSHLCPPASRDPPPGKSEGFLTDLELVSQGMAPPRCVGHRNVGYPASRCASAGYSGGSNPVSPCPIPQKPPQSSSAGYPTGTSRSPSAKYRTSTILLTQNPRHQPLSQRQISHEHHPLSQRPISHGPRPCLPKPDIPQAPPRSPHARYSTGTTPPPSARYPPRPQVCLPTPDTPQARSRPPNVRAPHSPSRRGCGPGSRSAADIRSAARSTGPAPWRSPSPPWRGGPGGPPEARARLWVPAAAGDARPARVCSAPRNGGTPRLPRLLRTSGHAHNCVRRALTLPARRACLRATPFPQTPPPRGTAPPLGPRPPPLMAAGGHGGCACARSP